MPNQQLCPLCNRRKAKRYCGRWDTGICARCCGTNRDSKSCPQGCAYLEIAIMELKERTGKLPIYKVLKTDGEGSHSIIVSRKKPNGNLQFISVLVDVWKMGLKDCFGSREISKLDFHNKVERMEEVGGPYIDCALSEALWLIKHGLRIANAVGTPIPEEFSEFNYLLGDMDGIEVGGSLYKCFECGKGELSEEVVEIIKDVTRKDMRSGVCGTPEETMIFFVCEDCKNGAEDEYEITEENCKQAIFDYAMENYSENMEDAYPEFPYDDEDLDEELAFKNFADWFVLERKQPSTGKTIASEFAERFDMDPDLRAKLFQMEQMKSGEFEILESKGANVIVKDRRSGEVYNVKVFDKGEYKKGRTVIGRLHPWGEVYRFAGVNRILPSDEELFDLYGFVTPDMLMNLYEEDGIKRAENIIINPKSTISSVMNKYPAPWVDGICNALGIEIKGRKREKAKEIARVLNSEKFSDVMKKLPDGCIEALNFVLNKGGWVKYGQLSRRFDGEIGYWWKENPPRSTLGLLRLHGLLFIGKMGIGGRMYRIAVVPLELRERIAAECADGAPAKERY